MKERIAQSMKVLAIFGITIFTTFALWASRAELRTATTINHHVNWPDSFTTVRLDAGRTLMVAKSETTVKQWNACVSAGFCPLLKSQSNLLDKPIVNLSWNDVQKYLDWISKYSSQAMRLPTQSEWLAFAVDHAPKPRQKLFDDPRLAWAADYDLTLSPQDSEVQLTGFFGSNQLGIYDLSGNVWEWTESCITDQSDTPIEIFGCINGRIAMGNRIVSLNENMRTPGNAGCSGNQPPANIGFRLVYEI